MVKVTIIWGKVTHKEYEVNTSQTVEEFKREIFLLLSIPVDKQKILHKGKNLKEGTLESYGVNEKSTIQIMGSAEERKIEEPKQNKVFQEDQDGEEVPIMKIQIEEQLLGRLSHPGGLSYLTSSLQLLKRIPEYSKLISEFTPVNFWDQSIQMNVALQRLFQDMSENKDSNIIETLAVYAL